MGRRRRGAGKKRQIFVNISYGCPLSESILQKLPIPCQIHGCPEEFMLPVLQNHEKECGFRIATCANFACNVKKPLNELINHMTNDHKFCETQQIAASTFKVTIISKGIFQCASVWKPTYLKYQNYDFFIGTIRKVEGEWYTWVCILASQRSADKFKFCITFSDKEEKSVLMYNRNVISIDAPKKDILTKKDSVIVFHDVTVEDIIENQRISYEITIKNK